MGGHSQNCHGFDPRPIQVLFVEDEVTLRQVFVRLNAVSADRGGASVCGRSLAGAADSHPAGGMFFFS